MLQRVRFRGLEPRIQLRPPSLLPLRQPEQRLLTTHSINWTRSQPTSPLDSHITPSMCQTRNLSLQIWRRRSKACKSPSRCSRTRRADTRSRIVRTPSLSLSINSLLLLRSQRHSHKMDSLRLRRRRRLTAETTHSSSRLPSRSRSPRSTTVRLRANSRITPRRTILSSTSSRRNTRPCSNLSRLSQ